MATDERIETACASAPIVEPVRTAGWRATGEPSIGEPPVRVIEPTPGWRAINFRELWRYRELVLFLTLRDIKARYKQTILGVIWAVIQPLMTTGIFAVLFALLLGRGKEPTLPGIPYVVSTFCAMLPWTLFAGTVSRGGQSLVAAQNIITKVYFPRVALPMSALLGSYVDVALAFGVLGIMMACYGVVPSWGLLAVPFFAILAGAAALGVSLWLSALSALYRDFRHVLPFVVRVGMFASPVVYATASIEDKLPEWAVTLYWANPMVGVIEGFRWALLDTAAPPLGPLLLSAGGSLLLLLTGAMFLRRIEGTVIDVV